MPTPEEKIKTQRMIEATRKGYMGMSGKFGIILQQLGEPIIGHGSPLFEVTYMETPYPEHEEEEMGYFDEDETVTEVGWLFSGLNRGMHLEITYEDAVLSVYYKGYPVYIERAGDLECFVPNQNWEQNIEQLYEVAIKLQRKDRQDAKVVKDKIKETNRKNWLQAIWKKWGFKL